MSSNDVSVVLVHGAWADGSSWSKVIAPLATDGVTVVAAQMPLTSLDGDVAAVRRAIDRAPGKVVLAGHAYGGAVISAVRDERVKALVYVAAGAPDEGETIVEAFYGAEPPKLELDAHGLIALPEPAFAAAFAPDATADEQAVLAAAQNPISPACITVPLPRPLWRDVPAWFLVAEQDRMLSPERQHSMATRMKAHLHSYATDHAPIVTAPWAVLSVIREAIASVGQR
jgi:pimeloyl-ACP methyl ester carboxylesterase